MVINRGLSDGIQNGMRIDFFFYDYLGGNELIATGLVVKASSSKSMVRMTSVYSKRRVKEGTIIRTGVISD